jgi:hypothetical protein
MGGKTQKRMAAGKKISWQHFRRLLSFIRHMPIDCTSHHKSEKI